MITGQSSMLWRFMLRDLRGASRTRALWVFGACLILGVLLIAVCGSLLRLTNDGLEHRQRELFGGDVEISQRLPIDLSQKAWIDANASSSLLIELRSMVGSEYGFTLVELQSVDDNYPLYGEVLLEPNISLQSAVSKSDAGLWGAVFDPVLANQAGFSVGDRISVGEIELELRARIIEQPDRGLTADVRGPPLILDEGALEDSGLLLPTSLVDYEYRVRTDGDPAVWRDQLFEAFPEALWEVQTVDERGEFLSRRLDQVASVLMLIGFSTLLIGGLGVANSVGAYLQGKLKTVATLQSLGARSKQVANVYIGQITLLAVLASLVGASTGVLLAWLGGKLVAEQLSFQAGFLPLLMPGALALFIGVLVALVFTLPVLGQALHSPTVDLMRGSQRANTRVPRAYVVATLALSLLAIVVFLGFVPDFRVALTFVLVVLLLMLLLRLIVKGIQWSAKRLADRAWLEGSFSVRMALASLYREDSALGPLSLSLGASLTLLVALVMIIGATFNNLNSAVPERAPSLVFYDLQKPQADQFNSTIQAQSGYIEHNIAPLVLGKLTAVNGIPLSSSDDASRVLEANDEHKLSYRVQNIDNTVVDRGAWWAAGYAGTPLVAFEDREADQLGLETGDQLEFTILGETVEAELVAIYSQARFETSFWLEAVFSPGVLDPYITRFVGSARLHPDADIDVQASLAEQFPNVVSVRTAKVLETTRNLLANAGLAIVGIGIVSLAASLLVMSSVVAVSRQRQVYEASILHALGARRGSILKSVAVEYGLLALVLSVFSLFAGAAIALMVLKFWLKIDPDGSLSYGAWVAICASSLCLFSGALWLMLTLRISPGSLLRQSANE